LVDILRVWLSDCKAHETCQNATPLDVWPTRVINISNDQIHLEQPQERLQEPYIALSHCWGTSNLPKTTKDSVTQLKNKIDWKALTKTFQDAITLTRRLGFRYIWIDSLCIIQDDENDWLVEASKMAGIYEDAELVISATSARDGSEGLFRERKPVQILASEDTRYSCTVRESGSFHKVISTHGPEEKCNDKDCPIYICRDTARHAQWDWFDMIATSSHRFNSLLTRAWAFQERLLATRIVHFADHELVWECRETQRCECMHLDRSDARPILERRTDNIKLRFSQATSPSTSSQQSAPLQRLELFELWAKVVENYTERLLTFEKDRLMALEGASKRMAKLSLGPCIGGLFLSDMPRCLLWHATSPGTRHPTYRAPTWAWPSIMPPPNQPPRIQYLWHHYTEGTGGYEHYPEESCIEPVDAGIVIEPPTPQANVEPQIGLHLRGPLISATLTVTITQAAHLDITRNFAFMLHDTPTQNYTYVLSRSDRTSSISFEPDIFLHHPNADAGTSTSEVFLLAVARRVNQKKPDQILVLRPLDYATIGMAAPPAADDPAFERIGIVTGLESAEDSTGKDWFDGAERKGMVIF
jgi:hypothetical protein